MTIHTQIEQESQVKDFTAPRVTPADIEANIASTHYFTAADGVFGVAVNDGGVPAGYALDEPASLHLLTFCVLVMRNGHTVTGEAYCANPALFNATTGREAARADAINKFYPTAIYAERNRLLDL